MTSATPNKLRQPRVGSGTRRSEVVLCTSMVVLAALVVLFLFQVGQPEVASFEHSRRGGRSQSTARHMAESVAAASQGYRQAWDNVLQEEVDDADTLEGTSSGPMSQAAFRRESASQQVEGPQGTSEQALQDTEDLDLEGEMLEAGAYNSTDPSSLATPVHAQPGAAAQPGQDEEGSLDDEFVVATFTDERRHGILRSQRAWRKSLRTYVASNLSEVPVELAEEGRQHRETWGFYPDSHKRKDVQWPGDHRGALAPFLAHQVFGDTYKWMLYGDDDTLFFLQGVRRLVRGLDPDLPYVITDWIYEPKPNAALRCMPCNSDESMYNTSVSPFVAPVGCPCTTRLLCESDPGSYFTQHWRPINCSAPMDDRTVPKLSGHTALNGGAGALLSIGLMRALRWQQMEACVLRLEGDRGSDSHITYCIWEGGYGLTGLPGSFYKDPQSQYVSERLFSRMAAPAVQRVLEEFVNGTCSSGDPECAEKAAFLDNMVSVHTGARRFKSWEEAQQQAERLMDMYHLYLASPRALETV